MNTYLITSNHDVFVDNYSDGEEPNIINGYTVSETISADNWKDAVNKYFAEALGYNLGMENCEIEDGYINTSCLVDADNYQPSQCQIDKWQNDEVKLYSNHITIELKELISVELV